jgi:rhodanese-related sulfurtransferase
MLIDRGYVRVRPLLGGLDAWIEAGYPVELIADASTEPVH